VCACVRHGVCVCARVCMCVCACVRGCGPSAHPPARVAERNTGG
jgi:hypothetical protein